MLVNFLFNFETTEGGFAVAKVREKAKEEREKEGKFYDASNSFPPDISQLD